MDLTTIALIAAAALALVVVIVMLRRSWGGSLDRTPLPGDYSPLASSVEPPAGDLAQIRELLARGNKIEAIKRYRELTGVGLKEAKDFVEALPLEGSAALPVAPRRAADLAEVYTLARQGRTIQAIKRYRELTGAGLKEAKDFVDSLS